MVDIEAIIDFFQNRYEGELEEFIKDLSWAVSEEELKTIAEALGYVESGDEDT